MTVKKFNCHHCKVSMKLIQLKVINGIHVLLVIKVNVIIRIIWSELLNFQSAIDSIDVICTKDSLVNVIIRIIWSELFNFLKSYW
jgi:hypothetical protein